MKKLAYAVLATVLVGGVLLASFNFYRESHALKSTGLDLSRWSVQLEYFSERSINLGADSVTIYGFALPTDFEGTSKCGSEGYSEVSMVPLGDVLVLLDFEPNTVEGCVRRTLLDHGTTYIHVLLDDRAFVKIM